MALLTVDDLSVRFTKRSGGLFSRTLGTVSAVDGVSFSIARGETLGLVGESGSGKTSLGLAVLRGIKPSSGRVVLHPGETDLDITALGKRDLRRARRHMQMIFQDPYSSLNPRRTVASIVALPLAVQGIGTARERRDRALAMLDRVGLALRHADVYPNELSGGQRQRVAIARALVVEPEIVLLDEPTSALDVSVQSQILNLLLDLRRDFGLTYIFISHNLAVIEHVATSVAVMYLGRIVETASREDLFRAPRHPYTRALLASVLTPEPGLGVPDVGLGLSFPDPLAPPPGCVFHPRCPDAGPRCRIEPPRLIRDGQGLVACHLHHGGTRLAA